MVRHVTITGQNNNNNNNKKDIQDKWINGREERNHCYLTCFSNFVLKKKEQLFRISGEWKCSYFVKNVFSNLSKI